MIVRKYLSVRKIIQYTWSRVAVMALIAAGVVVAHDGYGFTKLELAWSPVSVLGIALAILLGFRNNNAYDRWWEARRLWGAIVNDSRTVTRQVCSFPVETAESGSSAAAVRAFVRRQIAFAYACAAHLRKQDAVAAVTPFLDDEELARIRAHSNIPNAILHQQGQALRALRDRGALGAFEHMQIDSRVTALCDALGGCERIKNTVFPRQYSFYTTIFVWIFVAFLPFALVKDLGVMVVPVTVIIGFIFIVLERVGGFIENPFESTMNDIPMSAISRTIEINLLQALGEPAVPAPQQPIDGVLM